MWRFWDACGAEMGIRGEWLRGRAGAGLSLRVVEWVRLSAAVRREWMAVATTITMGMSKRLGDRLSIRKDVKKGYLTREAGDTIDVTAGLQASFLSAGISDAP